MTKADDSCKSGGDRPAQEIEITLEMIEAGEMAYADMYYRLDWQCDEYDIRDLVISIYKEMHRVAVAKGAKVFGEC